MYPTTQQCEKRIDELNNHIELLFNERNNLNLIIEKLEQEKRILKDIIQLNLGVDKN